MEAWKQGGMEAWRHGSWEEEKRGNRKMILIGKLSYTLLV
jgi:hypothetical protein